ncbi:MAG: hypothetical protein J5929_09545 [Eubacterium sp.]|nr:hypothetical protein [Eubacterium sp.]
MTLEETIKHYDEKAEIYRSTSKSKSYYNLNASMADEDCAVEFQKIADWLRLLKEIIDQGDCNDCGNRGCLYKPKPGQLVRYNCPLHHKEVKADEQV